MTLEGIKLPAHSRFLVTGGAGFIGANLVGALLQLGCKVRAMDNLSTGYKENIDQFLASPDFEFRIGDVRNLDDCRQACEGVDFVLHQAAWGSVPRSIEQPLLYEEINIGGTLKMLQAGREAGVKRFVYASSSSVYGDSMAVPKVEGEEGRPLSPYALTKQTNEMFAENYFRLYGLQVIGLRYFNVFGPKQDPGSPYAAVVPQFIQSLLRGDTPLVHGDGEQSRDFTYVTNAVQANLKACVAPLAACGQVFNVACGRCTKLNELLDMLADIIGVRIQPRYGPARPGDVRHSLADINHAKALLDYNPEVLVRTGLELTVSWFQANMENRERVSYVIHSN